MSLLGGLISTATNAVGANENAQATAAKSNMAAALQRAQLQRQDQQDLLQQAIQAREEQSQAYKDQLVQSQIKDTNSQAEQRAYEVAHPKPQAYVPTTREEAIALAGGEANARAQAEARYRQSTPDSIQYTTDPTTGENVVTFVNPRTHQITQSTVAKAKTGVGGGSAGAQVPVADMEQRYQEIAGHAQDLAAGKWKMTSGMQTREGLNYANAVGNAAGHPDITHQLLAGTLNTIGAGGDDYTKYQALLNSTRALGDDVAKVFKGRQNEQSVLREVALSELTPDDYNNPQVVNQKLSRLQHIIALAKLNNPGQEGLESPRAPVLTSEDRAHAQRDPEFAAWLHSQGYKQ